MEEDRVCADCVEFVSRDECKIYREKHDDCLKEHETRLNENAVEHATFSTEMRGVKWLLGGIFTVTFLSFIASVIGDFVK